MRRAVDGRFKVVFFATALPPLKVVTVTFGATVFLTALGVAFAVVEVLRVRLLRGAFGAVAVETVAFDLTGIGIDSRVYPHIIPNKKPLLWGLLHTLIKKSSLLTVLIFH